MRTTWPRRHDLGAPGQPGQSAQADEGSVAILILGMCMIALVLILGVVTVTSAHLARIRLLDTADAAALDASDTVDDRIYHDGVEVGVPLSDTGVRDAANAYLASRTLPPRMTSWAIAPGTGSPDGSIAIVVLTGTAQLPVLTSVMEAFGGSITITVESRARADLSP